jgi:hypothetical protein
MNVNPTQTEEVKVNIPPSNQEYYHTSIAISLLVNIIPRKEIYKHV